MCAENAQVILRYLKVSRWPGCKKQTKQNSNPNTKQPKQPTWPRRNSSGHARVKTKRGRRNKTGRQTSKPASQSLCACFAHVLTFQECRLFFARVETPCVQRLQVILCHKRELLAGLRSKENTQQNPKPTRPNKNQTQTTTPLFFPRVRTPCGHGAQVIFFFPRVRTPCGHGAQVIVEGREEQTDGGERNKDPKTNPKPNTQARRPKLHHLVVFPLHWVRHVKRKLVAINGPESSKEKDGSASCVHGKPPRRLQTDFPSRILVTSGHTTVWQNKVTLQVSVSRCSSAGCNQVDQE